MKDLQSAHQPWPIALVHFVRMALFACTFLSSGVIAFVLAIVICDETVDRGMLLQMHPIRATIWITLGWLFCLLIAPRLSFDGSSENCIVQLSRYLAAGQRLRTTRGLFAFVTSLLVFGTGTYMAYFMYYHALVHIRATPDVNYNLAKLIVALPMVCFGVEITHAELLFMKYGVEAFQPDSQAVASA